LAAGLLAACSRPANVVEAPMIALGAESAAVSSPELDAGLRTSPINRGDRFAGTYHCAQGLTRMSILIDDVGSGSDRITVQATFELSFTGDGDEEETAGSARLLGTFDVKTRQLHLKGDEWIEQPPGYALVNFRGQLKNGTAWSGIVEGPGCTTFETKLEAEH
jgi:hypothetical protein